MLDKIQRIEAWNDEYLTAKTAAMGMAAFKNTVEIKRDRTLFFKSRTTNQRTKLEPSSPDLESES